MVNRKELNILKKSFNIKEIQKYNAPFGQLKDIPLKLRKSLVRKKLIRQAEKKMLWPICFELTNIGQIEYQKYIMNKNKGKKCKIIIQRQP